MDTVTRQMRGCPHPCPGYAPAPEGQRPEQEVHLLGGDWYRARTCPGAVVAADGFVDDVLADYLALDGWCQGNTLAWWQAQPKWWTDAMQDIRQMQSVMERERAENR